jgi:hypothetical protein
LEQNGADVFLDPFRAEVLFRAAVCRRAALQVLPAVAGALSNPDDFSFEDWQKLAIPYHVALRHGNLDAFQILLHTGYRLSTLLEIQRSETPTAHPSASPGRATWWRSSRNTQPMECAALTLRDPRIGCIALRTILSGDWCSKTKNSDFSRFCELLVFLINFGADPAVSENGQTSSDLIWNSADQDCATVQRRVLLWYRALRSCGLNPQDYDFCYDSRFDRVSNGCHFCLQDTEGTDAEEFVVCPWCFGDLYSLRSTTNGWFTDHNPSEGYRPVHRHLGRSFSRSPTRNYVLPCCPGICSRHIARATGSGLLLPANSGAKMRRYRKQSGSVLTWTWCYSLDWIDEKSKEGEGDGEGIEGSDSGAGGERFHDALESV